jgi:hypothetical protein
VHRQCRVGTRLNARQSSTREPMAGCWSTPCSFTCKPTDVAISQRSACRVGCHQRHRSRLRSPSCLTRRQCDNRHAMRRPGGRHGLFEFESTIEPVIQGCLPGFLRLSRIRPVVMPQHHRTPLSALTGQRSAPTREPTPQGCFSFGGSASGFDRAKLGRGEVGMRDDGDGDNS